jgi:hypothetical protein
MKKLICEINKRKLSKIFSSEAFLKPLVKAGKITRKSGNESHFCGDYDIINGESVFSDATEGNYEKARLESDEFKLSFEPTKIPLFDFHYHPEPIGPAFPSDGDLKLPFVKKSTYYCGKYMVGNERDICGIGIARENKEIELLLYQPKRKIQLDHISSLNDKIKQFLNERGVSNFDLAISKSNIKSEEVSDILSQYYNSTVFKFPSNLGNFQNRKKFREQNRKNLEEQLKIFEQKITFEEIENNL